MPIISSSSSRAVDQACTSTTRTHTKAHHIYIHRTRAARVHHTCAARTGARYACTSKHIYVFACVLFLCHEVQSEACDLLCTCCAADDDDML